MPYLLVTAPASEPLSLQEAKDHLRVDASYTDTDALIQTQIIAARQRAEQLTRRALVTQHWKYVADAFPGPSQLGIPYGKTFTTPGHAILLEKSPVASVDSITYLDMSGVRQTMPATDYIAEMVGEPCRITPVFGKIWPVPLPQIGAVEVNFTAGYGALNTATPPVWVGAAVPEVIKLAMKLMIEAAYDASFNDKGNLEHERKMKAAENILMPSSVLI
jgi:uncharacterized phiE125 gp8 family phage protein